MAKLEEALERAAAAEAQRADADAALEQTRAQLAETQATSERRLQVSLLHLVLCKHGMFFCDLVQCCPGADPGAAGGDAGHLRAPTAATGVARQAQDCRVRPFFGSKRCWRLGASDWSRCCTGAALQGGRQLQPGGRNAAGGAGDL